CDWISVNCPTTFGGDDAKRALQRGLRDSLPSPLTVDEEARNPPVGRSYVQPAEPTHPSRQLCRRSELTPPNDVRSVVDEGCVGPIRSNKSLLVRPSLRSCPFRLAALEVEGDAPTASPDRMAVFEKSRKVRPCLPTEFPD